MFLFHTGSIKRKVNISLKKSELTCFYSILVRLKVIILAINVFLSVLFLFHTGSIKRNRDRRSRRENHQFLFHTGSIKSENYWTDEAETETSFDSILVRLKVFMKAIDILYGTLMIRVKSIFIYIVSETNLLSTGSRANSLGDRRILTKRAFPLLYSRNGTCKTDPNLSFA